MLFKIFKDLAFVVSFVILAIIVAELAASESLKKVEKTEEYKNMDNILKYPIEIVIASDFSGFFHVEKDIAMIFVRDTAIGKSLVFNEYKKRYL